MRRSASLISTLAAIGAVAAGTPASASDLLYPGGTLLTEGAIGKPVWMIQAQCAGFFGATSNVLNERGDISGAQQAKAQGAQFARDAIERLMKDRSLSRPAATEALGQAVDSGRAEGFQKIKNGGGFESRSHWNTTRSVCLDVADVYNKSLRWK